MAKQVLVQKRPGVNERLSPAVVIEIFYVDTVIEAC
jgi:hypothetical protein